MILLAPEVADPPLCRSVFPMISKYVTGTKPRAVLIKGLHASYLMILEVSDVTLVGFDILGEAPRTSLDPTLAR